MSIRERVEQQEIDTLSVYAAKSRYSLGREREEKPDDMRTCYARDRDRIIHSHAFRREKDKTQVFILPNNDHIMNRLTHTLEVSQIATSLAVALNLNYSLTEAIALGHDTAHTCFGHAGERALNKISTELNLGGYNHAKQARRRLNTISKLNISIEVLDGIENHSGLSNSPTAMTLEGQLIPFADKIAYLTSDLENAVSMGLINDYPDFVKKELGPTKSKIIKKLVTSIVDTSFEKDHISMDDDIFESFSKFREFNFKEIYFNDMLQEENRKCEFIINYLFEHFRKYPELITEISDENNLDLSIIDYIAGMTDKYAMQLFDNTQVNKKIIQINRKK